MTDAKYDENGTDFKDDEFTSLLKHAFWTVKSQGYRYEKDALVWINSGMLGYKKDKDGKQVPRTISRRSYFRYKKQFMEIPQIYEDIRQVRVIGYLILANGFNAELAELHRKTSDLLNDKRLKPMEQLRVIEVLCKTVMPTRSAMADITKNLRIDPNPAFQK